MYRHRKSEKVSEGDTRRDHIARMLVICLVLFDCCQKGIQIVDT